MLTIRGLGVILGDLAALGYDARWGVLGAYCAGAIHKRERIWICANMQKDIHAESESYRNRLSKLPLQFRRLSWGKETLAEIERGNDGVADWVDERNGAIGNGQVPAVVKLAWEALGGSMNRSDAEQERLDDLCEDWDAEAEADDELRRARAQKLAESYVYTEGR
jgi:DNA (cytosine-5)-methyltransferase 1